MPSRIRNHPMPRSFYWLAGRPPPPRIPEDETVQFTDGPADSTAGDGQTATGMQERSARRISLFSLLDSLLGTNSTSSFLGTSAAPGRVVTEADASEGTGEPQPAPEPDPTPEGQSEEELEQDEMGYHTPFWSTLPLRCEGCLILQPPIREIGLTAWEKGLPRSHDYALMLKHGTGLPCFSSAVRASVRWHLDHPGQRPRSTRWWCLACSYQNDQERYDFTQNWQWRNRQEGNGIHYRTIEEYAVNQFHWPRHVEFPQERLATMHWPEV